MTTTDAVAAMTDNPVTAALLWLGAAGCILAALGILGLFGRQR